MRTLLAALFSLLFAGSALATSVMPLSLADMKERANVVVEATVVDVRVELERDGTHAVTYTTLRVDDAIEGARRGELLVVFQPGAHPALATSTTPKRDVRWLMGHRAYQVGERVMFFGVRHRRAQLDVVVHLTLGYGTFDVLDDGGVRELVLDVIDATTHAAPRQRSFATRAAFRAALGLGGAR